MWLAEALVASASARCRDFSEDAPSDVAPGDICVVRPYDRTDTIGRLFVVVDTADGWCEGMLAGAETELATEVDAILPPSDTGLGYEIAVHSRFDGPVWIVQVLARVGAVGSSVLDDLERLAWSDYAQVSVCLGLPLQPEGIDPRYPALRALSAELDTLTDHCHRRRHVNWRATQPEPNTYPLTV